MNMLKTGFITTTFGSYVTLRLDHPGKFFQKSGEKGSSKVSVTDETVAIESEAVYYCSVCKHLIATAAQITEVNGQHHHVYANPAGNVFEIGCFSKAPGCISQGTPTNECTWFAGFSWRYSHCGQCYTHLGWKYDSDTFGSFFGLITSRLIRE